MFIWRLGVVSQVKLQQTISSSTSAISIVIALRGFVRRDNRARQIFGLIDQSSLFISRHNSVARQQRCSLWKMSTGAYFWLSHVKDREILNFLPWKSQWRSQIWNVKVRKAHNGCKIETNERLRTSIWRQGVTCSLDGIITKPDYYLRSQCITLHRFGEPLSLTTLWCQCFKWLFCLISVE